MRICCTIVWLGFVLLAAEKSSDIRSVNFANLGYPWVTDTGDREFRWLTSFDSMVLLRDGHHVFKNPEDCGLSCPALEIQEITFEDVNGDGVADSIVTLLYTTGGTGYWHYAYFYTLANSKPKLLAAFKGGSRLSHGLHRVFTGNGHLVIELNEAKENQGECCAIWKSRTEYEWRRNRFEAVSKPVLERIPLHERRWSLKLLQ